MAPAKFSEEEARTRKGEILDAAARVFAEKGYAGATVRDLEEAIGLSRGGIFFHFPGKRELYQATIERCAGAGRPLVANAMLASSTAEGALIGAFEAIVAWHREHPEVMALMKQMDLQRETEPDVAVVSQAMTESVDTMIIQLNQELQRRGIFGRHVDPETACAAIHPVMDALVERAMRAPGPATDAAADAVLRVLADGLRPRPDAS